MGGVKAVAGVGRKTKVKPDPSNDFEGVFDIEVPDYMEGMENASIMWRSVVPKLLERKTLKITDMHNVEMFCIAYENLRKSQQEVALMGITLTTDQGSVIKNPALTALNEASKQMASFGAMLGLDPSSRTRLTGAQKKPNENRFAKVLNM